MSLGSPHGKTWKVTYPIIRGVSSILAVVWVALVAMVIQVCFSSGSGVATTGFAA